MIYCFHRWARYLYRKRKPRRLPNKRKLSFSVYIWKKNRLGFRFTFEAAAYIYKNKVVSNIKRTPRRFFLHIYTENDNFRLFGANGNGKPPFVFGKRKMEFCFLGRQTINGNRLLLCQQMCPYCFSTLCCR